MIILTPISPTQVSHFPLKIPLQTSSFCVWINALSTLSGIPMFMGVGECTGNPLAATPSLKNDSPSPKDYSGAWRSPPSWQVCWIALHPRLHELWWSCGVVLSQSFSFSPIIHLRVWIGFPCQHQSSQVGIAPLEQSHSSKPPGFCLKLPHRVFLCLSTFLFLNAWCQERHCHHNCTYTVKLYNKEKLEFFFHAEEI